MSTWKEEMGTSSEIISLMQSIFANVSDAILVVDRGGVIVKVNAHWSR